VLWENGGQKEQTTALPGCRSPRGLPSHVSVGFLITRFSGPHRLTLVRLLYVGDLVGHLFKRRDGSLLILGKLLGERQAACIGTCQPPKGYGAAKAKLQALGHVFERARSEAGFEEG
jgi:hypothetical protein